MSNDPNRPQQLPYGQPGPQYGRYGQQPPPHPVPPYGQPPYGQQYGVPPVPNFVPQQAKKPRRALRRLLLIVAVFVVLVGGAIVAAVVITNHSSATATATRYYDAVKSQDYATAFMYLDPH